MTGEALKATRPRRARSRLLPQRFSEDRIAVLQDDVAGEEVGEAVDRPRDGARSARGAGRSDRPGPPWPVYPNRDIDPDSRKRLWSPRYADPRMILTSSCETSWGAHVPDLPGCVAVGETREEVLRLIREAIEFHIDGLKEDEGEFVEVGSA